MEENMPVIHWHFRNSCYSHWGLIPSDRLFKWAVRYTILWKKSLRRNMDRMELMWVMKVGSLLIWVLNIRPVNYWWKQLRRVDIKIKYWLQLIQQPVNFIMRKKKFTIWDSRVKKKRNWIAINSWNTMENWLINIPSFRLKILSLKMISKHGCNSPNYSVKKYRLSVMIYWLPIQAESRWHWIHWPAMHYYWKSTK